MRTTFLRVLVICVASIAASHQALLAQVGPVIGGTEGWVSCDSMHIQPWGSSYLNVDSVPSHERITSLYLSGESFALTKSGAVYGAPLAERLVGDTLDERNLNSFVFRRIPFDKPVKMVGGEASQFSMYLTYDGDVYATCSYSYFMPLLFGSDHTAPVYRPKKLNLPKKVRSISGGGGSALALLEDGSVW